MGSKVGGRRRWWHALAVFAVATTVLAGCVSPVDGVGTVGPANLAIAGYSDSTFDQQARNALSDVIGFWTINFPKVDSNKSLPPIKGKLYSVDGAEVFQTKKAPSSASDNACLQRKLSFIIDNAAYCQLDDSIIWDRSESHLLPVLSQTYGPALTALVFAHEFGHAVQQRLGIDTGNGLATIDIESQADCAAGAFAAAAMNNGAPHFHITPADLDKALEGYLLIRDSTPTSPNDISHGNGFDRLNALQEGIKSGVQYCYGSTFFKDRSFTERGYAYDNADYQQNGNEPLDQLLGNEGIATDLNRFWKSAGTLVKKTLQPVKLSLADRPACGASSPTSEFGYCPSDNTVYLSSSFATQAYNSLTTLEIDKTTADVTIAKNQPADYALGQLISIAWGMAARHQFFNGSTDDQAGLLAAICYSGAYAEDINRENGDATHKYILSPPDMDEATSATLSLVNQDEAFGARSTTGLQRIQSFVKGYRGGLGGCS